MCTQTLFLTCRQSEILALPKKKSKNKKLSYCVSIGRKPKDSLNYWSNDKNLTITKTLKILD